MTLLLTSDLIFVSSVIGKTVDSEGFEPVLCVVEVGLFVKLSLHILTQEAIIRERKTLYIHKVRLS